MKILIFGAGKQGKVAGHYLKNQKINITYADISNISLASVDGNKIKLDRDIFSNIHSDNYINKLAELLSDFDVVLSSATYSVNVALTKAAISSKTNMCDLGGNNNIVSQQLSLHYEAEKAGISIVPDCGLAPGMAGLLAAKGIEELGGTAEYVQIRVGGLPQNPEPPWNYKIVFSVNGLINEYIEDVVTIKNNKINIERPLDGLEVIEHAGIKYEAFNTSGGLSTLPQTYINKVKSMDYKTIRYPGHRDIVLAYKNTGFFDPMNREFTESLLNEHLKFTDSDKDLVLAIIRVGSYYENIEYSVEDFYDESTGFSAMSRTTAYSAAIIAQMLGENKIAPGVWKQECVVPLSEYIEKVKRSGISITRVRHIKHY